MARTKEQGSRLATDPATHSLWALKYVETTLAGHGVLAINLGRAGGRGIRERKNRIDVLLNEAGAALTRIGGTAALAQANRRVESEVLKAALITTASHDLRSPLAAILGSASVLDQMPELRDNEKMRALVDGMQHEAERLDNDIQNLLETVRITESAVRPHLIGTGISDVITAAIKQRRRRIAAHKLTVNVDSKLPLVNVDPVLLEQAIGHLVENAAKYSPVGSKIAIVARIEDGGVVVSIADQGAGLTEEESAKLFQRAYRGQRHLGRVPGLGLGLWIAQIFVAANGGMLSAESTGPNRGTTMSIRLSPPASPPPRVRYGDV